MINLIAAVISETIKKRSRCFILTDKTTYLLNFKKPRFMLDYYELYDIRNLKKFEYFCSIEGVLKMFAQKQLNIRGLR